MNRIDTSIWIVLVMLVLGFAVSPAMCGEWSAGPFQDESGEDSAVQDDAEPQEEAPAADDAQEEDGNADLEKAIELKETAASTRDLDKVVDLCESAIKKGLDESSKKLAEAMITSTLNDHIQQLVAKIDANDTRWRFLRREATTRLEKLLTYDTKNAESHLTLARLYLLPDGDQDKGREAVNKAIEFAGPDKTVLANALLLRSTVTEDDQEQLADLNQAIIIDPSNQRARIVRGQYYIDRQMFDEAIEDFRSVLEAEGELNPNVLFVLAQQLEQADRAADALSFIDKAIELRDDEALFFKVRGDIHGSLYHHEEARSDREAAVKLVDTLLDQNPDNIQALMFKAELQLDLNHLDEALKTVDRVLTSQPGIVSAIIYRSLVHSRLENHDKAIEDLNLVIESFPNEPRYQLQLAAYYNAAKQSEKSITIYNDLEKLFTEGNQDEGEDLLTNVIRGRADAYSAMGEHEKAIADYERVIEMQRNSDEGADASTLNNLAWLLCTATDAKFRNGARAVELATEANELSQYSESYALSTLGAAYAEIGDFEKAIEYAEKAVVMGEREHSDSIDNLRREVEAYQQKKPWREEINKGIVGPEGSEMPTDTPPASATDDEASEGDDKADEDSDDDADDDSGDGQ